MYCSKFILTKGYILFLLLLAGYVSVQGQALQEDIKRRQRAIFIYNFTQQVKWANFQDIETFRIGVLGNDPLFAELLAMSTQRTVNGKAITVLSFDRIDKISPVELLYVNKKYNFDIDRILDKIAQKNTLLVSENYNFNVSMVNIIDAGNTFHFEINETRLEVERFKVSPSLRKLAISSVDRWQELYLASAKSLENEREKVAEQKEVLSQQNAILAEQEERLSMLNHTLSEQVKEIEKRNKDIHELQQKYNTKIALLEGLEKRIENQVNNIAKKELEIKDKNREVIEQDSFLLRQRRALEVQNAEMNSQKEKIESQKKVLERQIVRIKSQRNITLLFGVLLILILAISFLIYRSYRMKKRSNQILALKNEAIREQALELEVKNAELEQFAYVASHDLQEPLRTIEGFIGILERKYLKNLDEKGTTIMEIIRDASVRMRQFIKGLLDHAKLGREVQFTHVDCNEILREIQLDLAKTIKECKAIFEIDHLPEINGYPTEIRLVFQNLISNAIKFRTQEIPPKIKISSQRKEEGNLSYWKFSVSDNGIGIDPGYEEKIFAIFQRGYHEQDYEGSGIGLAHCRKIVELHGGKIWVEPNERRGSTFFFTIAA